MDIVERLRLGDFSPFSGEYIKDADKDEAADEIERLRENAKRDAKYMLALHRIRQNRGNEFMEAFDQAVKLYEDEQPAKATGDE
jgi:hypothetical protein